MFDPSLDLQQPNRRQIRDLTRVGMHEPLGIEFVATRGTALAPLARLRRPLRQRASTA
jgi:hypothetical protein